MSTRSVVRIKRFNRAVTLYHHCDGYPEGVGFCLHKILARFMDGSWDDCDSFIRKMIEKGTFRVTLYNHTDIDYYYELDLDNPSLLCFRVHYEGNVMVIDKKIHIVYDPEKDTKVDTEIFEEE